MAGSYLKREKTKCPIPLTVTTKLPKRHGANQFTGGGVPKMSTPLKTHNKIADEAGGKQVHNG
jgi:hypothetical protein